ncbi:MAG: hypothetical protein K0R50_3463 [Eubacterium sp.]|nr:hypothetical protein [Eubacterium sp.]
MFENIEIPENIDEYIKKGLEKGSTKKFTKRLKRVLGVFICILITVFIAGIRVSPAFAFNVAKIPGLNYLVEFVSMDKGLKAAVDHEYFLNIGKSVEKQNIKLTVKDVIVDNSGIIAFYSLENKGDHVSPRIRAAKLTDAEGKDLEMSSSYFFTPNDGKVFEGKLEFYTNDDQKEIPENVVLKAQMIEEGKALSGTWEIPFSIDKSRLPGAEKVYAINKTIEIEGQKINFENIKIYPIKSILTISLDKSNSKKIFAFDDLKLIDDNGEEWERVNSGFTGSNPGDDYQTLNFQSNYFYRPKELYIMGSSIRALDKDKCYFTVDTEKRKISYSPYDLISLTDFIISKEKLSLEAVINKEAKDISNNFQISNEAYDSRGKKLEILEQGMGRAENKSYVNYTFKLEHDFKGPVILKICDYPSRIKGDFKIKIPLK